MDDREGRHPHRMIEPALLAAGIAAVILAAHLAQGVTAPPSGSARSPAASPSTGATDSGQRRIAPNFAGLGERTVVLAYRNAGLCEPAEIRMDGALLAHRLIGDETFLIVQVPRSAAAGSHRLDLYGTTASGPAGCGRADAGKRHRKIATTTFFVAAARQ